MFMRALLSIAAGVANRALPEVNPYGLELMQVNELEMGPSPPKICIVDSGIDLDHPEFNSANIDGEDSYNRVWEDTPMKWDEDLNGHGTRLAGIIAAIAGNDIGIAGVGDFPLYITRGLDAQGRAFSSDVKAAVEQCVNANSKIILLALGGPENPGQEEFYNEVVKGAGVMVVAASGNSQQSLPAFPGRYDAVISVGGVTDDGSPWDSSAQGIELVGPAEDVVSITPIEDEVSALDAGEDITISAKNSTGSAAAYVAAAAGLVWSHHPQCNNQEIRDALHRTAYNWNEEDDSMRDAGIDTAPRSIEMPSDNILGHGLPQVYDAVWAITQYGCDLSVVENLFPNGPPLLIEDSEDSEEEVPVEAFSESEEEETGFVQDIPSLDAEAINELENALEEEDEDGVSGGLIAGIVAAIIAFFAVVLCVTCGAKRSDASSAVPPAEGEADKDDAATDIDDDELIVGGF